MNVALRPLARGDEASLVLHGDDYEVWRWLRDRFPRPYTLESATQWIEHNLARSPAVSFAITVDGALVGCCSVELGEDVHRRSAEIGYWIGRAQWGRGVATKALSLLTEYAFTSLALQRLYALVFEGNDGSARVLEKCGYALEGTMRRHVVKDGATLDARLYARIAKPWDEELL